jgi:hypothetical protein
MDKGKEKSEPEVQTDKETEKSKIDTKNALETKNELNQKSELSQKNEKESKNEEADQILKGIQEISFEFSQLAKERALIIFDSLVDMYKNPVPVKEWEKIINQFKQEAPLSAKLAIAYFNEYRHKNGSYSDELKELIDVLHY